MSTEQEREDKALQELDEDFADDPDYAKLSLEEKRRLVRVMEKMLKKGIMAAYSDEEPGLPDSIFPCDRHLAQCQAKCCSFHFALTKEESENCLYVYDTNRPFFLAKGDDGYCTHMDRDTRACTIWEQRPTRCRRYDCGNDPEVWPETGCAPHKE
ncbi:MAG: YkgJ family cysteine cluster protein [Magnetococcales bacterium]|nr:YkgJ family cysteine cluster protein [Magnetococcales bacterium]